MRARGFAWGVSSSFYTAHQRDISINRFKEDFALMEASYVIIRLLQAFPNIRLPPSHPVVQIGQEKQELTIFLKIADGCKVLLS